MKNKPLKDEDCLYLLPDSNDLHDTLKTAYVYRKKDVKSAVEWLKSMLKGVMAQHEAIFLAPTFATEENKRIASIHIKSYKHALERIDEAFPDLYPSGDLIVDK